MMARTVVAIEFDQVLLQLRTTHASRPRTSRRMQFGTLSSAKRERTSRRFVTSLKPVHK